MKIRSFVAACFVASAFAGASAETSLRLRSEPGNVVGEGLSHHYTTDDAEFASAWYGEYLLVVVETPDDTYYLAFSAPVDTTLTPGTYRDVPHALDDPTAHGMEVATLTRGCYPVEGAFQIRELTLDASFDIASLWVTFEIRCEGTDPALRGDIRLDVDVPTAVSAPYKMSVGRTQPLSFDVATEDSGGRPVALTAAGLPAGASFTDNGNGTSTFSWVPSFTQFGEHVVTFHGDNGAGGIDEIETHLLVRGTTSLRIESETGDPMGLGETSFSRAGDGKFELGRDGDAVNASFSGSIPVDRYWRLDFAAPFGDTLAPGSYPNAMGYPFQDFDLPGLSVAGDGRACETLTGSFEVKQIAFGPRRAVTSLWATFEQQCEGAPAALRGEIRVNANTPVELTAPQILAAAAGQEVTFGVAALDALGGVLALTASAPEGASFVDHGDNTATFLWTPAPEQAGTNVVRVTATNADDDSDVVPTLVRVSPGNDDIENATPMGALPFTGAVDTAWASTAGDDSLACDYNERSVWYSLSVPADAHVAVRTTGSDYEAIVSIFRGDRGALELLTCRGVAASFDAIAGETYHVMVATYPWESGSHLTVTAEERPRLAVRLAVDSAAWIDARTGGATIGGYVTCSAPNEVIVGGAIRQALAGYPAAEGSFTVAVACSGRTRWNATVTPAPGVFRQGLSLATVTAVATDLDSGDVATARAAVPVQLARKKWLLGGPVRP